MVSHGQLKPAERQDQLAARNPMVNQLPSIAGLVMPDDKTLQSAPPWREEDGCLDRVWTSLEKPSINEAPAVGVEDFFRGSVSGS